MDMISPECILIHQQQHMIYLWITFDYILVIKYVYAATNVTMILIIHINALITM